MYYIVILITMYDLLLLGQLGGSVPLCKRTMLIDGNETVFLCQLYL